jgi:CelD/BcsL family acetyltransferase involved in cellulose biosynthesis
MAQPFTCHHFDRLDVERVASCGWQELFLALPDARFYHHPDWLLAANDHLLNPGLEISCVSQQGQLVLLLPWQACAQRHRLRAPRHDHLSLGDILIHPQLSASEALAALELAMGSVGTSLWDWQLGNLPQRSVAAGSLSTRPDWECREVRQSAWFDLDRHLPPLSGKLRRNLKRLRGKLYDAGRVQVQWISDAAELPEALAQFMAIEASGWKGASTAIASDPALVQFYQQLAMPRFAGMQPVVTLLWLDEHCIAAQFGLQTASCLSLVKIAYCERYGGFSPGSLLLQDSAALAQEKGLSTLSLVTSPAWAERWHPRSEPVWHMTRYANNSGGIALRSFNHLKQTARARLTPIT